jgi:hypothetical protein
MKEICKNCKWWDTEWFRKPEDDPGGVGWRYCNHPGFVGEIKQACPVTCETSSCNGGFKER